MTVSSIDRAIAEKYLEAFDEFVQTVMIEKKFPLGSVAGVELYRKCVPNFIKSLTDDEKSSLVVAVIDDGVVDHGEVYGVCCGLLGIRDRWLDAEEAVEEEDVEDEETR